MSGGADRDAATPLEAELVAIIAADGPIPIDRYMDLCLSHPRHGYYRTRDPLGTGGDFVTAPEISQMFGELIGLWCADLWLRAGRPEAVAIVEPGPGRGTLMADLLRAAAAVPGLVDALAVHLVETSPVLRARQQETLAAAPVPVRWHDSIADVDAAAPVFVIANEFLDALPVRQFVKRGGHWHERLVGLDDDGRLTFGLAPGAVPAAVLPDHAAAAQEAEVIEVSPARRAALESLSALVARNGGAGLVIDYGHARPGSGDTLQAVAGHRFADPLTRPGCCDLTTHVDFADCRATLRRCGMCVEELVGQGLFLKALGIEARAAVLKANAAPDVQREVDAAVKRLTDEDEMGSLFKVLAFSAPGFPRPAPFSLVA